MSCPLSSIVGECNFGFTDSDSSGCLWNQLVSSNAAALPHGNRRAFNFAKISMERDRNMMKYVNGQSEYVLCATNGVLFLQHGTISFGSLDGKSGARPARWRHSAGKRSSTRKKSP